MDVIDISIGTARTDAGPPEPADARRHAREMTDARIGMRKRGYPRTKADLTDISQTGFRIDSALNLAEGETVFVYLPGFQPLVAKVVWRDGFRVGCRFDTPISDYIYDRLAEAVRRP